MPERDGILVMAYGTPASLDDVESYYTDIRRGRPPAPEQLEELTARYKAIGGKSPLLEISTAQARGIQERLGVRTYLGQKHAAPFIKDAVSAMASDGVQRAVGLVLAPHYSSMSVGDYEQRVRAAAEEISRPAELEMIHSWNLEPGYIELLVRRVTDARSQISDAARPETMVVFSAHSLPETILKNGDPYPDQLRATAEAVAAAAGLEKWQVGWQSAGRTADKWLGPDVLEILVDLAAEGIKGVVVCPCGFVADHLEVLYDLDVEAAALAADLGIEFARTASPNDDPAFLDALATVARAALDERTR